MHQQYTNELPEKSSFKALKTLLELSKGAVWRNVLSVVVTMVCLRLTTATTHPLAYHSKDPNIFHSVLLGTGNLDSLTIHQAVNVALSSIAEVIFFKSQNDKIMQPSNTANVSPSFITSGTRPRKPDRVVIIHLLYRERAAI